MSFYWLYPTVHFCFFYQFVIFLNMTKGYIVRMIKPTVNRKSTYSWWFASFYFVSFHARDDGGGLGSCPCPFKKGQRGRKRLFKTTPQVISWFTKSIRNKFIAAISAPRKFRMVFYNFCYYFRGQPCLWTETNLVSNDFLFFNKFPLPSMFLLPSCPTAAPSSVFRAPLLRPPLSTSGIRGVVRIGNLG